jgi:hypothetical protein
MFTKVNVKDLKICAINWLIAKYQGECTAPNCWHLYNYSNDCNSWISVIRHEKITFTPKANGGYLATKNGNVKCVMQSGKTMFIAGLLCVIAFYYGDNVDIPTVLAI